MIFIYAQETVRLQCGRAFLFTSAFCTDSAAYEAAFCVEINHISVISLFSAKRLYIPRGSRYNTEM